MRAAAIAPSRLQDGAEKVMYASPCYTRAVALRTYASLPGGHARMQCVASATVCHTNPPFAQCNLEHLNAASGRDHKSSNSYNVKHLSHSFEQHRRASSSFEQLHTASKTSRQLTQL